MGLAVMDASVAVKWFLDEEYGDEALRLQSDFFEGIVSLRVPSILPYEVLNALQHSRRFQGRDLLEAARDIDRSGFSIIPLFGEYMERTVEIAVRLRCTIYDASYLALAAIEECVLFTADDGLVALAPREIKVVHVREYRRQGLGEPSVDESRAD